MIRTYFSDCFNTSPEALEGYGAFNISLVNDLPVFVDPFLIFNSSDSQYQQLHRGMIQYLQFLRDKSISGGIDGGLLKAWFYFGEVEQNWLGYSLVGNKGTGLGKRFAESLNANLHTIFSNFGSEQVTKGSHLEKLCLIEEGIGRDNISDFTTNLIKEFLLEYTQDFARQFIAPALRAMFSVDRVRFSYDTESWETDQYELPVWQGDFVLLTPRNILTKDETWISKKDMVRSYHNIAASIPNDQLRAQVNNYFRQVLPIDPNKAEVEKAIARVFREYPELIEYYIRYKEDRGDQAVAISDKKMTEVECLFIEQLARFRDLLHASTAFYYRGFNTYEETRERISFLKDVIENKDGYRLFYTDGKPIGTEKDLQLAFRLTWFATPSDVSPETNDGRGPVDFKISRGSHDKTLVEFKLASNTKLKRNLEKQLEIYKKAHNTDRGFKVILYFTLSQYQRVQRILKELECEDDQHIVLIDARDDNKPSASVA